MKQMLCVNCLVQVTTDNSQDFNEWLEYHISLGFDLIYVFDTGVRGWLDGMCDKYRDHVVLVPRDDWRRKSVIIETYTKRRRRPEWAICLSDNEFLWLDANTKCNIKRFINNFGPEVGAITCYTKYLSSEQPMKYRVGTQIDCFTHSRPNPQGFVAPNENTPNTGVTFFHIVNTEVMPMKNGVVPNTNKWIDSVGGRLSPELLSRTLNDRSFDPTRFPLRCYKFALRSGNEMNFRPGTKPVGYTVSDSAMQEARQLRIRVPVNMETEKLFAKNELIETDEQKPVNESVELSPEVRAEHELPITAGKIDAMILRGSFYEDVAAYLSGNGLQFDPDVLLRVFNRERDLIASSNESYRKLHGYLAEGKTDKEILKLIQVTPTTLANMKKCLLVLDISDAPAEQEVAEQPASTVTPIDDPDIGALVSDFDASVELNDLTAEQKAANDAKFAEEEAKINARKARRREKDAERKRNKRKQLAEAKRAAAGTPAPAEPPAMPEPVTEPDDIGSLLDDIDLSSLTDK